MPLTREALLSVARAVTEAKPRTPVDVRAAIVNHYPIAESEAVLSATPVELLACVSVADLIDLVEFLNEEEARGGGQ